MNATRRVLVIVMVTMGFIFGLTVILQMLPQNEYYSPGLTTISILAWVACYILVLSQMVSDRIIFRDFNDEEGVK